MPMSSGAGLSIGMSHSALDVFAGHEGNAFRYARWPGRLRQFDQALCSAGQFRCQITTLTNTWEHQATAVVIGAGADVAIPTRVMPGDADRQVMRWQAHSPPPCCIPKSFNVCVSSASG